jgi:hypothetical protein
MARATVILSPGQQRTEAVSGRFFTVVSATAKFAVDLGGDRREVRAGSIISGFDFRRVSFVETEGVTNTIEYDAGPEAYHGEVQVSGVSEATFDEPHALMPADGSLFILPGGGAAAFTEVPLSMTLSGVTFNRKSFHIANRDTTNDIGIYRSSDGKLMDVLSRSSERTFNFNATMKLRGIGGNADCAIFLTLYLTPPNHE